MAGTEHEHSIEILRELIETIAKSFDGRLRDIRELSTCPCRACASAGDLGLKFIVHRGVFSRQQIGAAVQLYGNDVNLVHRLAKNTVSAPT